MRARKGRWQVRRGEGPGADNRATNGELAMGSGVGLRCARGIDEDANTSPREDQRNPRKENEVAQAGNRNEVRVEGVRQDALR